MVAQADVKLEPFHITKADGNITAAASTATLWSDIWKYQVPQGTGIVLQAGDTFSAYLDDGAEIGLYDGYVKIEVRDSSEQDRVLCFGPAVYAKIREFQNRTTMARLSVAAPTKVYPRQWIVIMLKDGGTSVPADCYFDLFTSKAGVPIH
jgi:hypothetical protein